MLNRGSWVAIVTPMQQDLSVDYQALASLIEWHITSGTAGIVLLGTTGESPTINETERLDLIHFCCEKTSHRIQLMLGVGHNNPSQVSAWLQQLPQQHLDGLLAVTPCYNRPTSAGLVQYYHNILNQTDLPVVAYNVPSRTGCDLPYEVLRAIASHPNLVGLKEASGDLSRAWRYRQDFPELLLYSGNDDQFLPFMRLGGDGVISVAANILPHSIATICQMALADNWQQAAHQDQQLGLLYSALGVETNPIPCKYLLNKMGWIDNGIRPPLTALAEDYQGLMAKVLDQYQLDKQNSNSH